MGKGVIGMHNYIIKTEKYIYIFDKQGNLRVRLGVL